MLFLGSLVAKSFKWQWVLVSSSLITAACLVISPLDGVNQETASKEGGLGGAGTGGVGGASGSAGAAGAVACATHLECSDKVAAGEPARCVEGECVVLKTTECPCVPNVQDAFWENENSILIGAFSPLEVTGNPCEEIGSWNYRAALDELNNDNIQGLPGPNGARPIAIVICDNQALQISLNGKSPQLARESVMKAMAHLTTKAKVPGVLAYIDPGQFDEAFNMYAKPNGVLFLTPNGPTAQFANFQSVNLGDENKLAWHMLGRPEDVAPTYAAVFEKVAPYALANLPIPLDDAGVPIGGNTDADFRVALLYTGDAFSDDLTPAVRDVLEFKGTAWVDLGTRAREYELDGTPATIEAVWKDIAAWKPHVVVSTGGLAGPVLYEAEGNGWRPYSILSPYDQADLGQMITWIKKAMDSSPSTNAEYNERFVFINAAGTEDQNLLDAYKTPMSKYTNVNQLEAENLYDSVYFMAYAMFAGNGMGTPNGLNMGLNGMTAITASSPEFNVGADDIVDVFAALTGTGKKIRLNGTMGPPQFDGWGIRTNTGQLDCIFKAPSPPANVTLIFKKHVGHFDGTKLRLATNYTVDGGVDPLLPCLKWLNLPAE